MPKLFLTCMYCNKKWEDHFYSVPKNIRCPVCKDKNIKVKQQSETGNFYGYPDEDQLNPADAWIGNDD